MPLSHFCILERIPGRTKRQSHKKSKDFFYLEHPNQMSFLSEVTLSLRVIMFQVIPGFSGIARATLKHPPSINVLYSAYLRKKEPFFEVQSQIFGYLERPVACTTDPKQRSMQHAFDKLVRFSQKRFSFPLDILLVLLASCCASLTGLGTLK